MAPLNDSTIIHKEPWIMNASVRENIIFGRPFDRDRYETGVLHHLLITILHSIFDTSVFSAVIEACALKRDLEVLPAADLTEIGEKV